MPHGGYDEYGATDDDAEDGNGLIVTDINSTVDITKKGEYSVTYNYQDVDLNNAVEVIRRVYVCPIGDNWNPVKEKCE